MGEEGKRDLGLGNREEGKEKAGEDKENLDPRSGSRMTEEDNASGATGPQWLLDLIEKHAEESIREFDEGIYLPPVPPDVLEEEKWLFDLIASLDIDTTPRPGFREELWKQLLKAIDEMGDIITGKDENDT